MHPYPKRCVFYILCTHPDPTAYDFRTRLGLRLLVGLEPGTKYIGILLVVRDVGVRAYLHSYEGVYIVLFASTHVSRKLPSRQSEPAKHYYYRAVTQPSHNRHTKPLIFVGL